MQDIGSGIAYDYGVDPQGKMYIWDKWANKMVYYGDQQGGANMLGTLSAGYNAKLNFQGDQSAKASAQPTQQAATTPSDLTTGTGTGGGYTAPAKVLDTAQLQSLDSMLGTYDTEHNNAKQKAQLTHDASLNEKNAELTNETNKYDGKKLTTLQDFAGAKTDTDINTRNTLENLVSSLSTLGLGGNAELTRQITDAANMSNRKANQTQATNNQQLDSAFNDYKAGNDNDVAKINDQLGYDDSVADKTWAQARQAALYKKADVYNAADPTADNQAQRQQMMSAGDNLNGTIANAAFLNPSYTGQTKAMATPDLASYTQDIAKYDTTPIGTAGGAPAGGLTPAGAAPGAGAGNMSIRAVAVNDKDLGVKAKTEGTPLAYGV